MVSGLAAAGAAAAVRSVAGTSAVEARGTSNSEGWSCSQGLYIRWPAARGVKAYTLTFNDAAYGGALQTVAANAPFQDTVETEGEPIKAGKGMHQVGWAGGTSFGFGPDAPPCEPDGGYLSRLSNIKASWAEPGAFIEGRVTGPCKTGVAPTCPLKGVKVKADGKGKKAKGGSDTTDALGNYGIKVGKGSYTVTPKRKKLKFDPKHKRVSVRPESTATANFRAKTVPKQVKLGVSVVPEFPELNVDELPDGRLDPASTKVSVTVTNQGEDVAKNVTLEDLAIKWAVKDAKAPKPLTLSQVLGPAPAALGDLEPGEAETSVFAVEARGDGKFKLTAKAKGSDEDGNPVSGTGKSRIKAQSPILFVYTRPADYVPSPEAPKLVKAGTALSIRVRLVNRSYTKTIAVHPFQGGFDGNLIGGYLQPANAPIQNAPQIDDPKLIKKTGRFIILKPRKSQVLDAVYRTGYSNPETPSAGGTRGAALFAKPAVSDWKAEKGKLTPIDPEKVALSVGSERHALSIDDRPPDKPPFDPYAAPVSFSIGAAKGFAYSFAGTVKGIFYDLPILIGTAGRALVQLHAERTAELVEAIKDDSDARSAFRKFIDKQKEFIVRDLATAGKVPGALKKAIDGAFEQARKRMNSIHNKWYNGDWIAAAEELGQDTGQIAGDLALSDLALAKLLGGLPRIVKIAKAADKAKIKLYRKIAPSIEAFTRKAQSAVRSIKFLARKVKPGYLFGYRELEVLYGMTRAQARALEALSKAEAILIAVRSRGAGAVKWIKRFDAYVKPEWIKIKNVNRYDVEYLGYPASDLDRVVINRNIPSAAEVNAKLNANGITDPELRRQVLDRRTKRLDELTTDKPGYVKWIEEKARTGEPHESRFNWKDNGLDPTDKGKRTKAQFVIADKPEPGNLLVSIDGGPPRPITGDLDVVALTAADGTPLSSEAHERVLRALQEPPISIQHPETATWVKDGRFDFPEKVGELSKENPVQFAPDGGKRRVQFNAGLSFFKSKLNYFVHWEGGYRYLDWLKVPGLGTP